ncbi:MAG: hypothetical protein AB7V14_02070 [Kiritimatiellia bacterium]
MNSMLLMIGGALVASVALARAFFLARFRGGWLFYLANVMWEIFPKKLGIRRGAMEALAAAAGLGCLKLGGGTWAGVGGVAVVLGVLQFALWGMERLLFAELRIPRLFFNLEGPFVARMPRYRLGTLWTGMPFELELAAVNSSPQPWPAPLRIRLDAPPDWLENDSAERAIAPLPAGGVGRIRWILRPKGVAARGTLNVRIEGCKDCRNIEIHFDGCRRAADFRIEKAAISRYPGGRRSAFVWRGDMDLYDVRTFQSIAGLETTLGLSARLAFPQTMCLSTRLSFDETAAREFAAHEGAETGWEDIPRFIQWLREKVDVRHSCAFPAKSATKPYLMELGNHGHLHYDTAAAAAPENGWKSHAKTGAGRYPWVGDDGSSYGEQRDNILEAARWFQRLLGFTPRSWAKPGRCNDADTARAAEAAGCEVLSGSDIRARDNVLFQPPPHHPGGTDAVELTSRYPPDPQHAFHFFMLVFWLNRSRRLGRPMVFMCHQHMRQWEGPACALFSEALIRSVLRGFHGEFHVDTLFGVGKYWREVLSPRTRRVAVALDGTRLRVENRSDMDFERVPVDLELADGGRSTVLVSVRSGQTVEVDLMER